MKTTSKRVRSSTPRSKSGCSTCRQRHYKCDEAIPECRQCKSAGWKCPGYARTDSQSRASTPSSAIIGSTQPNISQYALAFKMPGSQNERRSLHHFCNVAAADMSGPLSDEFWSRTILQRCQHEPALRHAAVALGQIHAEYIATPKTSSFIPSQDTALTYGRAVKSLKNYVGSKVDPDRGMILMCSAIFFSFDLVRGEYAASMRHLRSGLEILKAWRSETSEQENSVVDEQNELLAVFARMDFEATVIDDSRLPLLRLEDDAATGNPVTHSQGETNLQQRMLLLSHTALLFLVESVPYKLMDIRQVLRAVIIKRDQLIQRFDAWEVAAKESSNRLATSYGDYDDRQAVFISTLHCRLFRLLLRHSLHTNLDKVNLSFDADEAVQMLDEAEMALQPSETNRRSFSLHTGVVAPMFLLAIKTSRPDVQERALNILRAVEGRQEGFLDAGTMAKTLVELGRMAAEAQRHPALEHTAEVVMYADDVEDGLVRSMNLLALGS